MLVRHWFWYIPSSDGPSLRRVSSMVKSTSWFILGQICPNKWQNLQNWWRPQLGQKPELSPHSRHSQDKSGIGLGHTWQWCMMLITDGAAAIPLEFVGWWWLIFWDECNPILCTRDISLRVYPITYGWVLNGGLETLIISKIKKIYCLEVLLFNNRSRAFDNSNETIRLLPFYSRPNYTCSFGSKSTVIR